jgi:hypothetical protein
MKVILSQINFIWGSAPTMSVTYTASLPVRDKAVDLLTGLLTAERARRGTRQRTRSLPCHDQAVLVLRWLLDGTRMSQLVRDNAISLSTGYDYLHEGIDVLAARAPSVHGALLAAKAAGYSHVALDGTLIATDRVSTAGPTPGVDLWWSGKHAQHGGTSRSSPCPTAGRSGPPTCDPAASTTPPRCAHTPRSCPPSPRLPVIYARWATSATKARPTPSPSRSRNPKRAGLPCTSNTSTTPTTASAPSPNAATPCSKARSKHYTTSASAPGASAQSPPPSSCCTSTTPAPHHNNQ